MTGLVCSTAAANVIFCSLKELKTGWDALIQGGKRFSRRKTVASNSTTEKRRGFSTGNFYQEMNLGVNQNSSHPTRNVDPLGQSVSCRKKVYCSIRAENEKDALTVIMWTASGLKKLPAEATTSNNNSSLACANSSVKGSRLPNGIPRTICVCRVFLEPVSLNNHRECRRC